MWVQLFRFLLRRLAVSLPLVVGVVFVTFMLVRIGGEYQSYRLNDWWTPSGAGMWPGTFENIKDGQRDRAALFGELEKQLDARWMALLGARYERVTTDAGNVHGYSTAAGAMGNHRVFLW